MTPDVRDGIPLPSRPFESPMPLSIRYGCPSVSAYPSLLTAGAHIPEADAAQAVASDPSVIDAEGHAAYRDGVEHATTLDRLSGGHKSCSTSSTPPAESCPGFATSAEAAAWAEGRLVPLTNAANRAAPMTPADHRTRRSSLSTDERIRQSRLSR